MQGIVGSMCGNQIVTEVSSLDNKYKLVVFVRDCGATTGSSTQVSILRNDKDLREDESGNVLIVSDNYFGSKRNDFGGADVNVKWIASRKVLIKYDYNAEAITKNNEINGIEITYQQID
jgi:hypothetical protein